MINARSDNDTRNLVAPRLLRPGGEKTRISSLFIPAETLRTGRIQRTEGQNQPTRVALSRLAAQRTNWTAIQFAGRR